MVDGQVGKAKEVLESLIAHSPKFALAQLMYADLLAARTQVISDIGGKFGQSVRGQELIQEANRRVRHFANDLEPSGHGHDNWPGNILKLAKSQKHVVIVEASHSRIYVFENHQDRLSLVGDYYVSVAKQGMSKLRQGDKRTPVGVYFITTKLDPDNLGDLYGHGALPINYPNEWDQRMGRTGYGIWLHGVPENTYSRAPYSSDGCLAMSNEHIALLMDTLDTGSTPVIIVEDLKILSEGNRDRLQRTLISRLKQWRHAVASNNINHVLRYYSEEFSNGEDADQLMVATGALEATSPLVTDVNYSESIKDKADISLHDISMFLYPGEQDLVVVSFRQNLSISDTISTTNIRQYWKREQDGAWRIVQQDNADFEPVHFRGIPAKALEAANIVLNR